MVRIACPVCQSSADDAIEGPQPRAARRGKRCMTRGLFASAGKPMMGGRTLARARRTAAAAVIAAMIAAGALASSAAATQTVPACPAVVIPNVPILPNAVGCWNAIAVQTIRLGVPYQVQGLIYKGYTQAAVYDAVTKIDGRYVPYHEFPSSAGVDVAAASPDAAAAYTMLTSSFLALPAAAQAGLSTNYADYINALGGAGIPAVEDGIKIGQAAASDLIADRTGDRNESITFTPGPLTPGGWTFAPLPSLQSGCRD